VRIFIPLLLLILLSCGVKAPPQAPLSPEDRAIEEENEKNEKIKRAQQIKRLQELKERKAKKIQDENATKQDE